MTTETCNHNEKVHFSVTLGFRKCPFLLNEKSASEVSIIMPPGLTCFLRLCPCCDANLYIVLPEFRY